MTNCASFKDPVSHMCLAGAMVASWSLTQEMAGSNPFTVMTNIFVTEFTEISETFRKISIDKVKQTITMQRRYYSMRKFVKFCIHVCTIGGTHFQRVACFTSILYSINFWEKYTNCSGGSKGTRGFQILSISCSFWEYLAKSYV